MKTILWKEGKVEIEVPDPRLYPPTERNPVFFNPRAKLSRDLSTLTLKAIRARQMVDAMCGTGVRGVRYAVEAGVEEIVFNDINPTAVELARKNAERNGIEGEFYVEDVNLLFNKRKFLGIDLDPFGSPSPYLQSTAHSIAHGGALLVTATDTSPLTGASPNAAVRKYHVVVRKVPWYRELAVRVLLGYVQHHLMVWEKALQPVLSFFAEHHIRIIGKVVKKPSFVTEAAKKVGMVESLGPLWKGPLFEREVVEKVRKLWDEDYSGEALRFVRFLQEEPEVLGYYDVHFISKELKVSPPPLELIIEALRDLGFRAGRSSLEPRAVKTDAPREVVKEVIRWASTRAQRPTEKS